MQTTTLDTKVHDFLAQKRIAVAGVSRDNSRHPVGNLIYQRLKRTGHDVIAVNPHLQTFDGGRCYPDLQSIPGGVDGVVIVTRPEATERIVRDCSDAGIHRVWMHQSVGKGSSVSPVAVVYIHGAHHSHLVVTGNVTWDLLAPTNRRPHRVTPYLVAGGGVFQTREQFFDGTYTSSEGAFTAGGGVRALVADRVTLGFDVRVGWETHIRIGGFIGLQLGR